MPLAISAILGRYLGQQALTEVITEQANVKVFGGLVYVILLNIPSIRAICERIERTFRIRDAKSFIKCSLDKFSFREFGLLFGSGVGDGFMDDSSVDALPDIPRPFVPVFIFGINSLALESLEYAHFATTDLCLLYENAGPIQRVREEVPFSYIG